MKTRYIIKNLDISVDPNGEAMAIVEKFFVDIKPYLSTPKASDIVNRPDIFTEDRLYSTVHVVTDYDDEGKNQPGETVETKKLVQPITE